MTSLHRIIPAVKTKATNFWVKVSHSESMYCVGSTFCLCFRGVNNRSTPYDVVVSDVILTMSVPFELCRVILKRWVLSLYIKMGLLGEGSIKHSSEQFIRVFYRAFSKTPVAISPSHFSNNLINFSFIYRTIDYLHSPPKPTTLQLPAHQKCPPTSSTNPPAPH